jgi:hypothetical protein
MHVFHKVSFSLNKTGFIVWRARACWDSALRARTTRRAAGLQEERYQNPLPGHPLYTSFLFESTSAFINILNVEYPILNKKYPI